MLCKARETFICWILFFYIMVHRNSNSIARLELHAPYHPYISVRIKNKYYNVDAACSNRADKYVHWVTHFHFDHIRSSIAGGADFLLKQGEKIFIFAPFDTTPINGETCFDLHQKLYHFHSKGKRVLIPIEPNQEKPINNSVLTAIPLKHSFMNLGLYIKKKGTDFTVLITGDWKGSSPKNREQIIACNPHLLVTECRYFEASKYDETQNRYHVHFKDLVELKKELPDTTIAIAHVSRTYHDIEFLVGKARREGFIFAKKILFYSNSEDYDIIEKFKTY
jgi:ribonuclease BN (tRNA processing enzyme)